MTAGQHLLVDPQATNGGDATGGRALRAAGPARRRRQPRPRWLLGLLVLLALFAIVPRVITYSTVNSDTAVLHEPSDLAPLGAGERRAALVLGGGLVGEQPTPILRDRIDAAIELLEQGRVDMIVMSGDNSSEFHDEPTVMRRYAIDHGVPVEQVAADYAGRRTWDSCARAQDVFGIDTAVVVTNAFHVDRAVFTCRAAGMRSFGYSVDDSRHGLGQRLKWRAREVAASGRALVDAWIVRPEPAVGGEPFDPWEPCQLRDSLAPSDAQRDDDAFAALGC